MRTESHFTKSGSSPPKSAEPREAHLSLKSHTVPGRYRVVPDAEGWPMIPGKLGQIEYYDGRDLAVYTDRARLHAKLRAIPGLVPWQVGDQELRGLFPPEALDQIAGVIRARRRRSKTGGKDFRPATRVVSGSQEPSGTPG